MFSCVLGPLVPSSCIEGLGRKLRSLYRVSWAWLARHFLGFIITVRTQLLSFIHGSLWIAACYKRSVFWNLDTVTTELYTLEAKAVCLCTATVWERPSARLLTVRHKKCDPVQPSGFNHVTVVEMLLYEFVSDLWISFSSEFDSRLLHSEFSNFSIMFICIFAQSQTRVYL